jgi:hypothetical protein
MAWKRSSVRSRPGPPNNPIKNQALTPIDPESPVSDLSEDDATVMVVKDLELGTNDCRGWIRKRTFEKFRFNDWGGSLGGPIWKNRTFAFGEFEYYKQSNLGINPTDMTVPLPGMMTADNGYYDFSPLLTMGADTGPIQGTLNPCTGSPITMARSTIRPPGGLPRMPRTHAQIPILIIRSRLARSAASAKPSPVSAATTSRSSNPSAASSAATSPPTPAVPACSGSAESA